MGAFVTLKVQGFKRVPDVTRWLADALHVGVNALDVKDRITVLIYFAASQCLRRTRAGKQTASVCSISCGQVDGTDAV